MDVMLSEIAERVRARTCEVTDVHPYILQLLAAGGALDPRSQREYIQQADLLESRVFGRRLPGPLLAVVRALCTARDEAAADNAGEVLTGLEVHIATGLGRPKTSYGWFASASSKDAIRWQRLSTRQLHDRLLRWPRARDVVLWLCLIAYEVDDLRSPLIHVCDGAIGFDNFVDLVGRRSPVGFATDRAWAGQKVAWASDTVPAWCAEWLSGVSLIDQKHVREQPDQMKTAPARRARGQRQQDR